MATHMKTTVEISDALFAKARRHAARQRITLKAVFEQGLRTVLSEKPEVRAFHLKRASFKGRGLRPEMQTAGWDSLRAAAYEGRGT